MNLSTIFNTFTPEHYPNTSSTYEINSVNSILFESKFYRHVKLSFEILAGSSNFLLKLEGWKTVADLQAATLENLGLSDEASESNSDAQNFNQNYSLRAQGYSDPIPKSQNHEILINFKIFHDHFRSKTSVKLVLEPDKSTNFIPHPKISALKFPNFKNLNQLTKNSTLLQTLLIDLNALIFPENNENLAEFQDNLRQLCNAIFGICSKVELATCRTLLEEIASDDNSVESRQQFLNSLKFEVKRLILMFETAVKTYCCVDFLGISTIVGVTVD